MTNTHPPAARGPALRSRGGGAAPPGAARRFSPLAILFLTVFLDLVGFGIVIPLLPLYAERFGATPVEVTVLVAVYSLMQFFFAPWWGQLSDRIGRRPVLLVGLFGSAASYLLFGLASSLAVLFAARVLAGFMGANVGVAQAYIADITPPERRARGMGLIGAAFGLGFIFGPAIGGLLSHFGPAVPFLGAGALALGNGILAIFWLPESLTRDAERTSGEQGLRDRLDTLSRVARSRRLAPLYVMLLAVTFAFAGMEATFSLWGDRRWRFTPAEVAYLFAYLGILFTVVQGALVGPLVRRLGERGVVRAGSVAFVVGMAGIALAPGVVVLAGALALLAFGQGTVVPAVAALVSRSAGPGEQGRLLSVSQSVSALGRVLGPVWGGVAFTELGISAPFLSAAGLVAVVTLLTRIPGVEVPA